MKHFDLLTFLNKFYRVKDKNLNLKKIWICLNFIYGLNSYSSKQLCFLFGINLHLNHLNLNIYDWKFFYSYLQSNFNFFLYDIKLNNVKRIRAVKGYKGWRHIFNLPVRGQRNHTNARTRKRFGIY